jgi:hypothetical protein
VGRTGTVAGIQGTTEFRGGTATIRYHYHVGSAALEGKRVIHIRGTDSNPGTPIGPDYLTAHNAPWYARYIFSHESSFHQFNNEGDAWLTDYGPNFSNIHGRGCPNWGYPNGWGVGQRDINNDTDPLPQLLWNWQANLSDGTQGCLVLIAGNQTSANSYIQGQRTAASQDVGDPIPSYPSHQYGNQTFGENPNHLPADAEAVLYYHEGAGTQNHVIRWYAQEDRWDWMAASYVTQVFD